MRALSSTAHVNSVFHPAASPVGCGAATDDELEGEADVDADVNVEDGLADTGVELGVEITELDFEVGPEVVEYAEVVDFVVVVVTGQRFTASFAHPKMLMPMRSEPLSDE